MARRGKDAESLTTSTIEEPLDSESPPETSIERSARAARKAAGEPERKKSVQVTLSEEVAWRLSVVARMEGKAPGQLVEPLIKDYLKDVRLPWDRYRHRFGEVPESQGPVSAA